MDGKEKGKSKKEKIGKKPEAGSQKKEARIGRPERAKTR